MQSNTQTTLTKSADAIDKIAKGYSTISTASKTMNVAAITATKGMFDALARIAEAPADNPLKLLADELFKAVKELTEVVNNLEGSMTKQSSASNVFADVIKTVGEKITGTKEKVQEKMATTKVEPGSIDLTPLLQAISDLEDRFNQPLYVIVEPS
jgi:phage shock protein A